MKVLMISLDRGLLGEKSTGDVILRHQKYADLAGALDVIVFASSDYERKDLSQNLRVFPTRSSKRQHFQNAVEIASRLAKEAPYDLLVTQDFAAPAGEKIKEKLLIPWIVNIHSMFFSLSWLKSNPLNLYLLYRIKKAIRLADGFRVNNEVIKAKLKEWEFAVPILVQPTPVDIEKFQIPNHKFQIKSKIQNPKVLYVGRLSPEKNVGMLIRAVKNLKQDLELQIVGSGSEKQHLEKLAEEDKRIKFLGQKSHEELVLIYGDSDIFVLPSNTESFGKVLIEAGAAGCALIATRTAGAKSIIEEEKSGMFVEVGDEKALEEALKRLVEDEELRNRLAKGAQEMAKRYDAEEATIKTVNFWKEIVNSSSVMPGCDPASRTKTGFRLGGRNDNKVL